MAAVLTPPRSITAPGRSHLRLVKPHERGETLEPVEPLVSPQAFIVAIVMILILMVGAVAVGRGAFAGFAPDAPSAATAASAGPVTVAGAAAGSTVVVRPGDTFWSIARDLQPDGDIRPLVDQLVAAHGSTAIAPGDRIAIGG